MLFQQRRSSPGGSSMFSRKGIYITFSFSFLFMTPKTEDIVNTMKQSMIG